MMKEFDIISFLIGALVIYIPGYCMGYINAYKIGLKQEYHWIDVLVRVMHLDHELKHNDRWSYAKMIISDAIHNKSREYPADKIYHDNLKKAIKKYKLHDNKTANTELKESDESNLSDSREV